MKWRQLADFISKMPAECKDQLVRFVEPYDDDREGYPFEVAWAEENIYIGTPSGETVFVKAGEPVLR